MFLSAEISFHSPSPVDIQYCHPFVWVLLSILNCRIDQSAFTPFSLKTFSHKDVLTPFRFNNSSVNFNCVSTTQLSVMVILVCAVFPCHENQLSWGSVFVENVIQSPEISQLRGSVRSFSQLPNVQD